MSQTHLTAMETQLLARLRQRDDDLQQNVRAQAQALQEMQVQMQSLQPALGDLQNLLARLLGHRAPPPSSPH